MKLAERARNDEIEQFNVRLWIFSWIARRESRPEIPNMCAEAFSVAIPNLNHG